MRLRRRRRWALAFNKLFRRCFLLLLLSASLSVIAYYWDNVERNSNNGKKKTGAQNVFTCSTVCTETPFNLISFLVLRAHPAVCACVSVCSLLQFWPYYLLFISKSPCMRPRVVWHRWSAQVHAHVLRASDVCTGGSDTQLCVCMFTEKKYRLIDRSLIIRPKISNTQRDNTSNNNSNTNDEVTTKKEHVLWWKHL